MYWCSENKGTDQLSSYCTADLCHCVHICRFRDCLFSGEAAHSSSLIIPCKFEPCQERTGLWISDQKRHNPVYA